jgi:phosphoglycolate phosphatase
MTPDGKVVIGFDLDGTLVDSAADIAKALNGALAELGLGPLPLSAVRSFVGDGARMLVERGVGAVGAGNDDAFIDDVLARFRVHYGKDPVGVTVAFDGIDDALDDISDAVPDAVFVVVTNKPGVFARPIVDALFPGRFSLVVGPDDLGCQKPDKRVLDEVKARLGASVDIFVGDGGTDVGVAKAAGIPSVGVTWGLKPDEARGADVVIDEVKALGPALKALMRNTANS